MNILRKLLCGLPLLVVLSFTGCIKRLDPCSSISIADGDEQIGGAGQSLAEPLIVQVTDENGKPLSGVLVSWAVVAGNGKLSTFATPTDASGRAQASWTLGQGTDQHVRASFAQSREGCSSINSVEFVAELVSVTINKVTWYLQTVNSCQTNLGTGTSYIADVDHSSTQVKDSYYAELVIEIVLNPTNTKNTFYYIWNPASGIYRTSPSFCVPFFANTSVSQYYTIYFFQKDANGNKIGSPVVSSNRIGPVTAPKPTGAYRVAANSALHQILNQTSSTK